MNAQQKPKEGRDYTITALEQGFHKTCLHCSDSVRWFPTRREARVAGQCHALAQHGNQISGGSGRS